MSDLFVKLDRVKVNLAALELAAALVDPDFRGMLRMMASVYDVGVGLSDVEAITAIREACDIWLRNSKK